MIEYSNVYQDDLVAFAREQLGFYPDPLQTTILAANPRRCLLNCTRQWGKSTITAIKALHNAVFHKDSLTLVLSPSARQSDEFIHKVEEFVIQLGFKPRGDGKHKSSVRLPNKSRIIGLPCIEGKTRGFSKVSLVLIDEASRVPDELYLSIRPTLAVSNGSLWLISTPNGRRGFFFDEWDSRDPDWTRLAVPASKCPRIPQDFLKKELSKLGERYYRQEYCCEFHDAGGQLISGESIDRSLSDTIQPLPFHTAPPPVMVPHPQPERQPDREPAKSSTQWPDHCDRTSFYIGIDFGKRSDYTAIAVLEKSRWYTGAPNHYDYQRQCDIRFAIRHLERFPLNTSYTEITSRIGHIVREFHPKAEVYLIPDATGIGELAFEFIRNLCLGRLIYPVIITGGELESMKGNYACVPKRDLIMKLAVQFEEGFFKIASSLSLAQTLRNELASLGHRFSNSGHDLIDTWRRDQHDDLVFAVALANWCARRDRWHQ